MGAAEKNHGRVWEVLDCKLSRWEMRGGGWGNFCGRVPASALGWTQFGHRSVCGLVSGGFADAPILLQPFFHTFRSAFCVISIASCVLYLSGTSAWRRDTVTPRRARAEHTEREKKHMEKCLTRRAREGVTCRRVQLITCPASGQQCSCLRHVQWSCVVFHAMYAVCRGSGA